MTQVSGLFTQAGAIDVVEASIAEIRDAIVTGRTTCRLVVQAYLDRIEAYDKSTVNAITVVNPNALSRADNLDALLAATPDLVASGNPGCLMQLAAGLAGRTDAVRVVHPVELLLRATPVPDPLD